MVRTFERPTNQTLPGGISLAELHREGESPLRICAVLRSAPGVDGPAPIVIRERVGARVFLGAVCDAGGCVQQWVEIWVQCADGLAESPAAAMGGGHFTNHVLDEQWRRRFAAMDSADPTAVVRTGWERDHPIANGLGFWVLPAGVSSHSAETGIFPLQLCTDDALLEKHDLPAYTTGLHRYLLSERDGERFFIPVTRSAPENENTRPLDDIVNRLAGGLVPFNVECGLMIVRRFETLSYEQFLHELGSEASSGSGGSANDLSSVLGLNSAAGSPSAAGEGSLSCPERLFLGRHDPRGALFEILHLKLRLLAGAVGAVHRWVRHTQTPILDLREESFRVGLGDAAWGLPRLWTARCAMVEPSEAIAMPLRGSDLMRFLRSSASAPSIFYPGAAYSNDGGASASASCTQPVSGPAYIRVRHVIEERDSPDNIVVQGTFSTQERIATIAPNDLIWLRVPTPVGRVDLYATLERDKALAAGEWRFSTSQQRVSSEIVAVLRDGPPNHAVEFDLLPNLSAPIDLYSLAVLAVRTLLVDRDTTLPRALDEVLSLARQVDAGDSSGGGEIADSREELTERIRAAAENDERWMNAIGPQRLWQRETSVEDALEVIPEDVWCEVLAAIVCAFPGACAASHCRDFSDAPAGRLHRTFEPFLADLERLCIKTRSQIVFDWRANREVQEVLDLCLQEQ